MNVVLMADEILVIANPVVRESPLPDLSLATEDRPEGVGVSAFDQLDRVLQRDIDGGSQQEMNVLGHEDEGMQSIAAFAAISVESLKEEANIVLDNEKFSTLPRRESDEVGSGRGDESSRLQEQTSAAKRRVFCLG